jgi:uncharacterized protein YqfA (UPF0365 family)
MEQQIPVVAASFDINDMMAIAGIVAAILCAVGLTVVVYNVGAIWLQGYMSRADVSVASLIGMALRQVNPRLIVTAKIMGVQAGLSPVRDVATSTAHLEAHFLAGGDVMRVVRAIIGVLPASL